VLYKETASKETPVGRIPEDWKAVRIDSISEVHRGASPRPIGDQKYFSVTGRGWIRISDVTGAYKYLGKTDQYLSTLGESKSVKVDPGDLIMSICATIGKPIIIDMKACIHDGFVVFRNLSRDVNAEFLFYFLQKNVRRFRSMKQTGTQGNLNTTLVGETFIPVPSLGEQKGIIEVLGVVDSAIELVDRVVLKTERLKKGLMQELLTKGIGHTEYKQTTIGTMPNTWMVSSIDEECIVGTGGTPSRTNPLYFGGNVAWVKSTEVNYNTINVTGETLTETGMQNSNAKKHPKGSLIVALYGQGTTRGKCAILGIDAAINQACAAIQSKGRIHIPYLFYWFQNSYVNVRRLSQGANQANLNMEIIRSLRVPVPSIPEQKKIAEILSSVDKKLELEKREKTKFGCIKLGLMDLLLTGKLRIKVD